MSILIKVNDQGKGRCGGGQRKTSNIQQVQFVALDWVAQNPGWHSTY